MGLDSMYAGGQKCVRIQEIVQKKFFFAACRDICKVADAEKKYFAPP